MNDPQYEQDEIFPGELSPTTRVLSQYCNLQYGPRKRG